MPGTLPAPPQKKQTRDQIRASRGVDDERLTDVYDTAERLKKKLANSTLAMYET
jgi:hypothetical protein